MGGVAIYVKHNIKFTVNRELKLKVDDCESLFIELDISDKLILGSQKTVLIGCIYRHPRPQTESFLDSLSGILDHYTQRETPILIMGDINYDVSNKDKASTKLYENMLNSFGCSNIISVSTRFGKSNNAILDHIITNYDLNKTVHGVLDFTMTDHLPIFALLKYTSSLETKQESHENTGTKTWQKIDDSKKDEFIEKLEENLSTLCLDEGPEDILEKLTQ